MTAILTLPLFYRSAQYRSSKPTDNGSRFLRRSTFDVASTLCFIASSISKMMKEEVAFIYPSSTCGVRICPNPETPAPYHCALAGIARSTSGEGDIHLPFSSLKSNIPHPKE